MSEYSPPQHAIDEWKKHCECCSECSTVPCDGVSAGGMCDGLCHCNYDYDYEGDLGN